jgi:hypothetical protein
VRDGRQPPDQPLDERDRRKGVLDPPQLRDLITPIKPMSWNSGSQKTLGPGPSQLSDQGRVVSSCRG